MRKRSREGYCAEAARVARGPPARTRRRFVDAFKMGVYHSRAWRVCPGHGAAGSPSDSIRSHKRVHCIGAAAAGPRPRAGVRISNPARDSASRHAPRVRWPHAGHELQHAKRRDLVTRIVRPAQDRQQILDVGRFEKLEAAVLHEGNVAPRELDFEQIAVVRTAKQHRLASQQQPRFAIRQDPRDHVFRLRLRSCDADVTRVARRPPRSACSTLRCWRGASPIRAFAASRIGCVER